MLTSLCRLVIPALMLAVLGFVSPALANKTGTAFSVQDGGEFFSKDAVAKANKKIAQIKKDFNKDLAIETIAKVSDTAKEKVAKDKAQYFADYARKRYDDLGARGVYLIISKDPQWVEVYSGRETSKKAFTATDRKEARDVLRAHFKKKDFDGGLVAVVDEVESTLAKTLKRGETGTARTSTTTTNQQPVSKTTGSTTWQDSIWRWVCVGLVVVLGIWVVFALIRAFSGGGSGGGGYGGGGYGGGGGGFFPSLMGGLFGAAAGMYLYDSFFRSNTPSYGPSAHAGDPNTGGTPDDAAGGGGTGGDWGNDDNAGAGGNDGGDWGGGGNDGGDWGGGGGDAGGDWGGGGGDGGGDW